MAFVFTSNEDDPKKTKDYNIDLRTVVMNPPCDAAPQRQKGKAGSLKTQ